MGIREIVEIVDLTDTEVNALFNDEYLMTEDDLRYLEFEDLPEMIPVVKRRKLSIISQYLGAGQHLDDEFLHWPMAEIQRAVYAQRNIAQRNMTIWSNSKNAQRNIAQRNMTIWSNSEPDLKRRIVDLTDTEYDALKNKVDVNDLRYLEFEDLQEMIPVVKRRKVSIISQYLGAGQHLDDSISMAEIQRAVNPQRNMTIGGNNNDSNSEQDLKRIADLTDTEVNALKNKVGMNDLRFSEFEDLPETIPVVKRRKVSIISEYLGAGQQLNDNISMAEIQRAVNAQRNTTMGGNSNILSVILLSILGWTPAHWRHVNDKKWLYAAFHFILFLLDFVDAIFDFILGARIIRLGKEGAGMGFGIFLIVATILGRLISGLYGRQQKGSFKDLGDDYYSFSFALMELTVFFVEDGAAIFVLANSTGGGLDIVAKISMYLTLICGFCYTVYFIFVFGFVIKRGQGRGRGAILSFLIFGGCLTFQSYILFTQVLLSQDGDGLASEAQIETLGSSDGSTDGSSDGMTLCSSDGRTADEEPFSRMKTSLRIASFLVYCCPALILGGIPIFGFELFGFTVDDIF